MDATKQSIVHLLAVPFPGQGHINPMMQLCKKLAASMSIQITFVLTQQWHAAITKSNGPAADANIGFAQIPDVIPSEESRWANFRAFLEAVAHDMEGPVQQLMDKLNQHTNPVSCIIADAFLPWAVSVANKHSLPLAFLWTECLTVFSIFYHSHLLMANGHLPSRTSAETGNCIDYIPGVAPIHQTDLPSALQKKDMADYSLTSLLRTFENVGKADWIVANSFYELESLAAEAMITRLKIPVCCVGPLLPCAYVDGSDVQDTAFGTSSRTELDCSKWLDGKAARSVVYVSFGSLVGLSTLQMQEIAMGLLESGHPFLWILRGSAVDALPGSFLQETQEKGLIVPWSNQLAVLSHPSVGAFFTHCGWNSTLESLCGGVPMLAFPAHFDQLTNCKLIVDEWKIGLRLRKVGALVDDGEVIQREGVSAQLKRLVDGEEGKEMRKRAEALRDLARKAATKGGSSYTNLQTFMREFPKQEMRNVLRESCDSMEGAL